MWHRRNQLFAAIILCTVYYRTVAGKRMDMAQDAVDDMYDGCRQEAFEKFIHLDLLGQELNISTSFQEAWKKQETKCSKMIPKGRKEHSVALSVYANEHDFVNIFDNAVETMGTNISTYEDFHFKSFHFLLMDAMKLLNSSGCKSVYFVSDGEYKAEPKTTVRFGTFKTVYLNIDSVDSDLDGNTVFNITSCFFAALSDHSCVKNKPLALISPAEEFTVEGVYEKTHGDADYTEIALKHSAVLCYNNCLLFSRSPAHVSTPWLVLLLLTSSFFVFYC